VCVCVCVCVCACSAGAELMEALRWFVATEEELKTARDASRKLSSANEQVLSRGDTLAPRPVEGLGVRISLHLLHLS
jgi:hypothetical protein